MLVEKICFPDFPFSVGVEQDEIGVESRQQCPLAPPEAKNLGRMFGKKASDECWRSMMAVHHVVPAGLQCCLNATQTAPGPEDAPRAILVFLSQITGRMIGTYRIDGAVQYVVKELFRGLRAAQRRGTF